MGEYENRETERDLIASRLEREVEEKGEKPSSRSLKCDDWSVSYYEVNKNFEDMADLMWRLGYETEEWKENDDLVEHELRGLEHELGRAPLTYEARFNIKENIEPEDIRDAGIPYKTFSYGPIEPERENEIIEDLKEKLVVEGRAEQRLTNNQYSKSEISMFKEGYLPWIAEEG